MADYATTGNDAPFWSWQIQKRRRARLNRALSVSLSPRSATVKDDLDVTGDVRVSTASINDGGVGTSSLSLGGPDAADFTLTDGQLFLNSGTSLSAGSKTVDVLLDNDARPDQARNTFTLIIEAA